jgi:hypothetical protein
LAVLKNEAKTPLLLHIILELSVKTWKRLMVQFDSLSLWKRVGVRA